MTIPSYFTRDDVKRRSKKQEKRLAKRLGGRTQKGSGSVTFHKGDVKSTELLVEAKQTVKASMSVKREWLEKISREAMAYNKVPALALEFVGIARLVDKDWIAVPASFFEALIAFYREQTDAK